MIGGIRRGFQITFFRTKVQWDFTFVRKNAIYLRPAP
jgi:hypothetical protein